MYQNFGKTPYGFIKIESQAIVSLVAPHLPAGVLCSAVRLRANDRLCLVVISDRREFWSREDDMRRARAITDDLREAGMDLPRLRWIRQSRFSDRPVFEEKRVYAQPIFWTNIVCGIYAFFVLPWSRLLVGACIASCAWLLSFWLIVGGGLQRLKNIFPFLRREK